MFAPRVIGSLIWSLALSIALFACGDNITPTATALSVSPATATVPIGATATVAATYREPDGSTAPAATATWASDNVTVATVAGGGDGQATITGVAAGTANITATGEGFTASIAVTVSPAGVTSIAITPPMPQLAVGTTAQLTATATLADGTTTDVTASATWTSTDTSVATVSAAGVVGGVAPGTSELTAAYGGAMGTITVTVSVAHVVSIAVTPTNPSIAAGSSQQLAATGTLSNGTVQDLTAQVAWTSGTPAVATVGGNTGTVVGVTPGASVVTATLGAVSGTTTVTVTPAVLLAIDVEPALPTIAAGATQLFTATGFYSDGSHQDLSATVTWSSGTPAVATIGASGVATGVTPGTSTITATSGALSGATVLTVTAAVLVSIDVEPGLPAIAIGQQQPFTATGTYSDLSTHDVTSQVTWASSATTTATISNAAGTSGLATSVAPGTTTITATLGAVSGARVLTVTAATLVSIGVTPPDSSVPFGETVQFTATGVFTDGSHADLTSSVVWSSGTETTATVSNAAGSQGLATPVAAGTTLVTATSGAISGSTTLTITSTTLVAIQVTPTDPSIPLGAQQRFTATGIYADGLQRDLTYSAAWSSSDPTVAAVSYSFGLATPVAPGTTTITATVGAISGSTTATVTPAVVTAIDIGPAATVLPLGVTQPMIATAIYSDLTHRDVTATATWASSDPSIASVSNAAGTNGVVTGLAPGSVQVSATFGGVTNAAQVRVTSATLVSLEIEPANDTIFTGADRQFTAWGQYSDGSIESLSTQVTWLSSDPTVATISNDPELPEFARAVAPGTTTITATLEGVSASTTLTVRDATVTSIEVGPADEGVSVGTTESFEAIAHYDSGATVRVTAQATWTTSDATIATVSNVAPSTGYVTGRAGGTATVSATFGGITGSTTVTVIAHDLLSIAVTPAAPSIAAGFTQPFIAIGTYSDGSMQWITSDVTWVSSDPATAAISNVAGSNGVATGVGAGTTTITATLGAISGSTTLAVTDAVLVSITVTPTTATLAAGATQQFTATATMSDGTTVDITSQPGTFWVSTNWGIATAANAPGSKGLVSGVGGGTAQIWALNGAASGIATLVVTPVTLAVTPSDGATGVSTTTPITLTFSTAMLPASVTAQAAAGPCSGTVQLSADDFATCVGLAAPAFDPTGTVATLAPAAPLAAATVYRVKVTTGVTTPPGGTIAGTFTQPNGWTTN